jgi:hypothetical protein
MDKEKILMNFRTFKTYKTCFEFVAKKRGLSLTQYINQTLFEDVLSDIVKTAMDDALQVTALQYELPNYLTIRYSKNQEDDLRSILGDQYQQFEKDWSAQGCKKILDYCAKVGLGSSDSEYASIMRKFAENTAR